MTTQLTSANGTPEEPLPESPVLTAREDDVPRRVRRVIQPSRKSAL